MKATRLGQATSGGVPRKLPWGHLLLALLFIAALSGWGTADDEITLRDFNTPIPSDPFHDAVGQVARPSEMLQLAVANDHCQLGFNDEEVLKLISVAELYGAMTAAEGQRPHRQYRLEYQSAEWEFRWSQAARVVRLRMCEPLVRMAQELR